MPWNQHQQYVQLAVSGEVPTVQFQLPASQIWRGSWTKLLAWSHTGGYKNKYKCKKQMQNKDEYNQIWGDSGVNSLHIQSSTNANIKT